MPAVSALFVASAEGVWDPPDEAPFVGDAAAELEETDEGGDIGAIPLVHPASRAVVPSAATQPSTDRRPGPRFARFPISGFYDS